MANETVQRNDKCNLRGKMYVGYSSILFTKYLRHNSINITDYENINKSTCVDVETVRQSPT